jgi:hypothetical protein
MTSQSRTAAVGARRRPAPPGPAVAPPMTVVSAPATYVPETYDPRHTSDPAATLPGQFGLVIPKQRTGRGVWVVLLLIVASILAFVGSRAMHTAPAEQPGVAYTSTAGHFTARFPTQPVEVTKTVRNGKATLAMHLAVAPGQGSVGELAITGSVKGNAVKLTQQLAASVGSAAVTLTSVKNFVFQGMRAQQGNYIRPDTGELATAMVVVKSKHRLYLVLGLTGPTFDALKESFRPLP